MVHGPLSKIFKHLWAPCCTTEYLVLTFNGLPSMIVTAHHLFYLFQFSISFSKKLPRWSRESYTWTNTILSFIHSVVYGAPCVKLRNMKFCIVFLVKLYAISYIVAIYLYCKKTLKLPFNCHGDTLTKTVSVALSLFP